MSREHTTQHDETICVDQIVSRKKLAQLLGVSVRTVEREMANGLPFISIKGINRKRYIKRFIIADVMSWYKNQQVKGANND